MPGWYRVGRVLGEGRDHVVAHISFVGDSWPRIHGLRQENGGKENLEMGGRGLLN